MLQMPLIRDDLRTYMFDEDGSLVFIDNDAPDIAVGIFDVYQGADKIGAYSDLSGYTYNDAVWFNKVDLENVTASENYSPIDAVSVKRWQYHTFNRNQYFKCRKYIYICLYRHRGCRIIRWKAYDNLVCDKPPG